MERYFMIFNVSELANINFEEVLETSVETIRKSINNERAFIKWEGPTPTSISSLTTKEGPYSYSEILTILDGPEWTTPMDFN